MKIKILIFPVFVVIDFVLILWYIKPNIDGIFDRRSEIASAEETLSRIDTITQNIDQLDSDLQRNSDIVSFIDGFYPQVLDEEKTVDLMNYLARQAGIVPISLELRHDRKQTESTDISSSGGGGEGVGMTPGPLPVIPESYTVTLTAIGGYSSLKNFFKMMVHSNRVQTVKEFSLSIPPKVNSEESEDKSQADFLKGTFIASFPYLTSSQTTNALNNPIFSQAHFDFSSANALREAVTNLVPPLEVSPSPRADPFH